MSQRLHVGNLSYDTTDEGLRSTFSQAGNVTDVHVVVDRETGRPRGFAFVELGSEAEAQAAVETLDGTTLDGRDLRVSIAKARPQRN